MTRVERIKDGDRVRVVVHSSALNNLVGQVIDPGKAWTTKQYCLVLFFDVTPFGTKLWFRRDELELTSA